MAEDGRAGTGVDIAGNQQDDSETLLVTGSVGLVWPGAVAFRPQGCGLTVSHYGSVLQLDQQQQAVANLPTRQAIETPTVTFFEAHERVSCAKRHCG